MAGYGGGGGHYSKYTQQVSFREPGQTGTILNRSCNVFKFKSLYKTVCVAKRMSKKTAKSRNIYNIFIGLFCQREDISRHFIGLISDSRPKGFSR